MFSPLNSSQTLNSAVLAKARMRAELGFDHTHKHRQLYTYCQDYHSMTFEPIDVQAETKAQRYIHTHHTNHNSVIVSQ